MPETVIIPLDGSTEAERAIPAGVAVARSCDAGVVLLTSEVGRVVLDPVTYLEGEAARHHLDGSASLLVCATRPAHAVVEAARTHVDPVVCMTSHTRRGVARAVLGSVAEDVVRAGGFPVILLGPDAPSVDGPFASLVVPLDGSDVSRATLPVAERWAADLGLPVHVVRVVDDAPAPGAASVADAERYLVGVAERLRRHGLGDCQPVVLRGEPDRAIATFAAGLPAPLVLMATHSRSGVRRAALGSVAMGVVRRARCPVLLFHPPAASPPRP